MSGPQRTPVRAALRMSWRAVELSFAEDTIQTRMAPVPPVSLVILFWSLPTQTTERRLPENPANQLSR